jgi:hypothetical protein
MVCSICLQRPGKYLVRGLNHEAVFLCELCASRTGGPRGSIVDSKVCNACRKYPGEQVRQGIGWDPDNSILLCRQCAEIWDFEPSFIPLPPRREEDSRQNVLPFPGPEEKQQNVVPFPENEN